MYAVHRYTQADQQAELEKERRLDILRRESEFDERLCRQYNKQFALEDRAAKKRSVLITTRQKLETDVEESVVKAQREKKVREQQEQQEEGLARELERINWEKECDEKMRQQIRETSAELREFESMLKAAYTNKERQAQMAEKEAHKSDEKVRDLEVAHLMAEQIKRAEEVDRQRELQRYETNKKYHEALEHQLKEQELRRGQSSEERIRDKLIVDEIVRKTFEEDEKARELARLKRQQCYESMLEERQRRYAQRQGEHEREVREDEQIAAVARERALQEEQRKVDRTEQIELREKFQREMAAKLAAEREQKAELEQMRYELGEEELREKDRQRELEAEQKRQQLREELQQAVRDMSANREAQLKEDQRLENYQLHQMLAKWAEDDRLERENAEKRRAKMLEYKQLAEKLLLERQKELDRKKELEREAQKDERHLSQFQQQIVEEERRRLLIEHAPNLLGYLPKGVIRNEQDLELLGADYQRAYSKQTNDPFTQSRVLFADK